MKAGDSFSKKDIHALRVSIKRIKALSELTEAMFPLQFDSIEQSLLFRKIFKNAGKLRETDLNTDFLKSFDLPRNVVKPYLQYLQRKKQKACIALKKKLKYFDGNKLNDLKKKLLQLYKEMPYNKLEQEGFRFISKECKEIKQLKTRKLSVPTLHQIRKHLKKLAATSIFLNKIGMNQPLDLFIKELKGTEELIGQWHDKIVLKASLEDFINGKQRLEISDKKALQKVINNINFENKAVIKKLKSKIDSTLQLMPAQ